MSATTSESYLAAQREDFHNLRKMNFEDKQNILVRNIKRHQNNLALLSPSDVAKRDKLEDNIVKYFSLMYSYINCCITILGLDGPDDTMSLAEREDAMRIHDSVLLLMRTMLDVNHIRKRIDPMKLKKVDAMITRRVITPIPSPATAPTIPPTTNFGHIVNSLVATVDPHTPCAKDIGAKITGMEMAETAERLQYVAEGGDLDTLTAIVDIANIPNELLLLSDADMDTRTSLLSVMDVPVLSPLPKRHRSTSIHKVSPTKVDAVVVPAVTPATNKLSLSKNRKRERTQYPSTTGKQWIRPHKKPPVTEPSDMSDHMYDDNCSNPSTSEQQSNIVRDQMRQMADMISDNNVGEFDMLDDDTQLPPASPELETIIWSSDEEAVTSKTITPPPHKKRKTLKTRVLPTTIVVPAKTPPTTSTYPSDDKMAQSRNLTKYMREGFKIKVFTHGIRAMLWCVIRDYLRDHYVDDFDTWYTNLERDKSINFYFDFDHILKDGIKRLHAKCKLPADVTDSARKMNKGTYNTIKNLIKFSPAMDWYKFALSNNGGKMNTIDYFTLVEIHDTITHAK